MKNTYTLLLIALVAAGSGLGQQTAPTPQQQKEQQPITIKKGDGISPPRVISAPNPKMPPKGVYGTVVIQGVVGTDGRFYESKVKRSLSPENDASALEAIKEWKFEPAKKDGTPVAARITVEVAFFPRR